MGERRGTKALELWCRRITEGYPDVNVQNMTTSWRDGLAFCAMIHHFRPDLIDFDSLDKNDVYGNNELAFKIAEQHLGIPALLDAEDMASCSVPDRLSILTYLSQFYQTFGGSSPARLPVTRTEEAVEESITQVSEPLKEKEASCAGIRRDSCIVCGFPIFLAEKLVLAHVAYHRTCFRCARCNNQLTVGNYYETEEGQYCCETCPDEEIPSPMMQSCDDSTFNGIETHKIDSSYKQLSSSEENTNKVACNRDPIKKINYDDSVVSDLIAQTSRLRLHFISNQLLSEEGEQVLLADDSHTDTILSGFEKSDINFKNQNTNSIFPANYELRKQNKEEEEEELDYSDTSLKLDSHYRKNTVEEASGNSVTMVDYIHDESDTDKREPKDVTATLCRETIKDILPLRSSDEELFDPIDGHTYTESTSSIVQQRRRMFETKNDYVKKVENKDKDFETLKLKVQIGKHEVTGNTENLTINPDTTESIIFQEDALKVNIQDISIDNAAETDCSEVSQPWKVTTNLPKISLDTKSNEHQTYKTFANDTNETSTTCTNLIENYPEDLNPFKSDEEDDTAEKSTTTANTLDTSSNITNSFEYEGNKKDEVVKKKEVIPPKPAMRNNFNNGKSLLEKPTKRRLAAPQINLNPFWSDDDDHDSDLDSKESTSAVMPTPKPRTIKHIQDINTTGQKSTQNLEFAFISNNCLRSPESGIIGGGAYRKKKPAPLPPKNRGLGVSEKRTSSTAKDTTACTFKTRKPKPAPPPPVASSSKFEEPPLSNSHTAKKEHNAWEDQKVNKDETNRNTQSFTHMTSEEDFHYRSYLNKSIEGKWKRKKGPAPPCPISHRRKIKVMSLKDVKLELDEIELQQQGLEKQGVRLEQLIRSKCESESKTNDISLGTDVEELVLELFALVNEKNELFRRQAELTLLRRQQRLEEEHAAVEYQIRCLMSQHESTKTDFDKQREEALIQRLIEIVERRNEIVDCLEMDRRREIEEDRSIHRHMDLFVAKNKNESSCTNMDTAEKKKWKQNKSKEKIKEKKLRKTLKKDIDKDIDEIELTLKRHTKRKWF